MTSQAVLFAETILGMKKAISRGDDSKSNNVITLRAIGSEMDANSPY
jgi:hypothetical protein